MLTLILVIGACFAYRDAVSQPRSPRSSAVCFPRPQIVTNPHMLYIAIGILGATVMPHNLYLHSSIVQTRAFRRHEQGKAMAIRFATIDSTVALLFAFFINAAILIVAARAFHGTAYESVADINDAHQLLSPVLGATLASVFFAVALVGIGSELHADRHHGRPDRDGRVFGSAVAPLGAPAADAAGGNRARGRRGDSIWRHGDGPIADSQSSRARCSSASP